ncbi:MAG TPA: cytochrome P450 [Acidimicrobiales bacterium]|nr:cytochrome P450 [Acidimicrobiales bacterium]
MNTRPTSPELDDFMASRSKRADPYPMFHQLQGAGPTYYSPLRAWLITRYADVMALLRSPSVSSMRSMPGLRAIDVSKPSPARIFARNDELAMLNRDPPEHTRVRRLVSRAFSASVVSGKRDEIRQIAEDLLAPHLARGGMELVHDFAYPLPLTVIASLLGVPDRDRERFRRWSTELTGRFGVKPQRAPAARRAGNQAMTELTGYFRDLVDQRRRHSGEDLISRLVTATDGGEHLTEEELVANCVLLLNAGYETTANLIGNGIFALLRHTGTLRRLYSDRALVATAVDELLRYDSSVQLTPRTATADVVIDEVTIPAGSRLLLMLGAANRDGERFADPDDLDIARKDNHHLAFGWGIHYCLGASLARLEIEMALDTLLARCANLRLATEQVMWKDHFSLRGLEALPVRWDPA